MLMAPASFPWYLLLHLNKTGHDNYHTLLNSASNFSATTILVETAEMEETDAETINVEVSEFIEEAEK